MFLRYVTEIIKLNHARLSNHYIKPRFINFLLTYRCNARCIMCNVWDLYSQKPALLKDELTPEEIKKFILDNLDDLSELRNVGFTGGDPLLMRNDFVEIVGIFKSFLPRVHLGAQTNGLIPELVYERLKKILSFCPDFTLAVSIDGIGDIHAQVRGVDSAFDKATQTIRYAQELGIKNITCGMTLNGRNFNQIRQVKDYVERIRAEFSCFAPEISEYFNNESTDGFQLGEKEWHSVSEQLKECCGYHYFMDNLRLMLEGKRKRRLPCFSGLTSLVIDPYGNIKPCVLKVKGIDNDVFGNIKSTLLRDMLSSRHALQIKERIKRCSCWCQCEVSTSVIIYPLDIIEWFVFYCRDKKGFIAHILGKKKKYSSLL